MSYFEKKKECIEDYFQIVRTANVTLEDCLMKTIRNPKEFEDLCKLLTTIGNSIYNLKNEVTNTVEEE